MRTLYFILFNFLSHTAIIQNPNLSVVQIDGLGKAKRRILQTFVDTLLKTTISFALIM
jgi:hypothetical protein